MTGRCLALLAALAGCDGVFGLVRVQSSDAGMPGTDADADAAPGEFAFVNEAHAHSNGSANSLAYPVVVAEGSNALLVYVGLGSNCPPGALTLANVQSLTYGAVAGTQVTRIQGTPCAPLATSSEVWRVAAPPPGTHDVVVILSTTVASVHSAALVFSGADTVAPITCVTDRGDTATSVLVVPSAAGEIVVSYVGQGKEISRGGSNATNEYIDNVNDFTSLNNTAVSTIPGDSSVTASWTFAGADQWQAIGCSLPPAP